MSTPTEQELKKEFLLERVILFSDAVFAIIITIMVIEIHLPEGLHHAEPERITEAFKELIPKVTGYVLSFAFIAMFWMRHLKIFSFLKDFNRGLLILNLMFLFFLSLFPATVSFISGAVSPGVYQYKWGFNIYVGVVLCCTFMQAILVNYLITHRSTLCIDTPELKEALRWKVQRAMVYIIPAIMLIVLVLNYFDAGFQYTVIPVGLMGCSMKYLDRKHYPNANSSAGFLKSIFGQRKKVKHIVTAEQAV